MQTNVLHYPADQAELLAELAQGTGIIVASGPTGSFIHETFRKFAPEGSVWADFELEPYDEWFEEAKKQTVWLKVHGNNAAGALSRLDMLLNSDVRKKFALVKGAVWQNTAPVLCPKCKVPVSDYTNKRGFVTESRLDDRVREQSPREVAYLNDLILSFYESVEKRGLMTADKATKLLYLPNDGKHRKCDCARGYTNERRVLAEIMDMRDFPLWQPETADFESGAIFRELRKAYLKTCVTLQERATRLAAEGVIPPYAGCGNFALDLK